MFSSREVVNRGWSVMCMNVEDALGKRRGKAWHAGKAASADARSKWVLMPKSQAVLEAPDPASTSFRQRDPFDGCNVIYNIVVWVVDQDCNAGIGIVLCFAGKLLLEISSCNHAASSEKHYTCISDPLIQTELK